MADVVIPDMTAASRLAVSNPPSAPNLLGLAAQALQMRDMNNNLALFGAKQAGGQAYLNALTANGTIDPQQLRSNLQNSGNPLVGMVAPQYVEAANTARNMTTQNAGMNLDQQLTRAKGRGQVYQAWLALPPAQRTTQTLDSMINDAGQQFGSPQETQSLQKSYNSMAPDQLESVIRGNVALGGQNVGPGGAIVNTGMSQGVVNTNPYAPTPIGAPVGGSIKNTVAPGQQNTVRNDQYGNPFVEQRDAWGNIVGVTPYPSATGNTTTPQTTLPAGETPQSMQELQNQRQSINHSAASVPMVLDTSNQIARAADELGAQGKLGTDLAKLGSQFGYNLGDDSATAIQKLGHYTALQTVQLSHTMGLDGSVAGLGTASQIAGKTDWTPDAIKSVSQTNSALANGIGAMNQGLEAAIQRNGGNLGVTRQFQNAWSAHFNVDSMRLLTAIQADGGKLGPNYMAAKASMGPAAFKAAANNAGALSQLTQGIIPK